jgi:hypothetical protein
VTLSRLQLALGRAATLVERLPDDGVLQRFAARAPDAPDGVATRLVVVHPPVPDGPTSGALLDRMAAIRTAAHPAIAAPLATGDVDASAWVVEPWEPEHLVAERLDTHGPLSVQDTVRLLRDVARALTVMHRRGLGHGAISAETVAFSPQGATLHGLGRAVAFTPTADLAALGRLGVSALTGRRALADSADWRRRRPAVPSALATILDGLLGAEAARVPPTAEGVLERLDEFPAVRQGHDRGIVEGTPRGARVPGQRQMAMLLALTAVAMMVVWLLTRDG